MRYSARLFIVILLLFKQYQAASEEQHDLVMAVLGDSIPSATFADTSLISGGAEMRVLDPGQFFDRFFKLYMYTGLDVFLTNKGSLSWASGKKIRSHFQRLREVPGYEGISAINVAVPGNSSQGLNQQISELLKKLNGRELVYVTLMVGADDACSKETATGTPNEKMLSSLLEAFSRLAALQQALRMRVLVSAIPKIPDLGREVLSNEHTIGNLTCRELRGRVAHPCDSLTEWTSGPDYIRAVEVVKEKNEVLKTAVKISNDEYPDMDIHYSDDIFESTITADMIAADCFHPNQTGHEVIAEKLWNAQPWF